MSKENLNQNLIRAIESKNLKDAEDAIQQGADVNTARNKYDMGPLSVAYDKGDFEVCLLLLDKGADVNAIDRLGRTVLREAAFDGNLKMVKMFTRAGANVNFRDTYSGQTSLYWSAREGHVEVTKWLIDNGADVNIKTDYGMSPLEAAERNQYAGDGKRDQYLEIIKLLKSNGATR